MIKRNRIRCKKCNTILESNYRHDFKGCKCGVVTIDGGHDYLKRGGEPGDWEELSTFTDEYDENIS